jgi:hypothetical protein
MSLTSYRAAPPRATNLVLRRTTPAGTKNASGYAEALSPSRGKTCEWVQIRAALASMPGDDLLFHRLSDSTIGAVWFHGRVRDGIGWVTDAMATKQWGQRNTGSGSKSMYVHHYDE